MGQQKHTCVMAVSESASFFSAQRCMTSAMLKGRSLRPSISLTSTSNVATCPLVRPPPAAIKRGTQELHHARLMETSMSGEGGRSPRPSIFLTSLSSLAACLLVRPAEPPAALQIRLSELHHNNADAYNGMRQDLHC